MPRKEKKQLKAVFKVKIICKEQIVTVNDQSSTQGSIKYSVQRRKFSYKHPD